MEVTCRCGASLAIPDDEAASGRDCPACSVHIRILVTAPRPDGTGLTLRCFCTNELQLDSSAPGTTVTCGSCQRQILVPATDGIALELSEPELEDARCSSCGAVLAGGDSGQCGLCRAATPRVATARRTARHVQPGVRRGERHPLAWLLLIGLLIALLVTAVDRLRREPASPSGATSPAEAAELVPATFAEVTRHLQASSPVLLSRVAPAAFTAATAPFEDAVVREWLVGEEPRSHLAWMLLRFAGRDAGQTVTGELLLSLRAPITSLEPERDPPLFLVELLSTLTVLAGDGQPSAGQPSAGQPSAGDGEPAPTSVALTCAYHPRTGVVELRSWQPPLAGATTPDSPVELPTTRAPGIGELATLAATQAISVLRLLAPLVEAELIRARPGCEIVRRSHTREDGGMQDLTWHLLGGHPGDEQGLWRLTLTAEAALDQLDRAGHAPLVPLRLTLSEHLIEAGRAPLTPAGGTVIVPTRADRASGQLYLPPRDERELRASGLFPDWGR